MGFLESMKGMERVGGGKWYLFSSFRERCL